MIQTEVQLTATPDRYTLATVSLYITGSCISFSSSVHERNPQVCFAPSKPNRPHFVDIPFNDSEQCITEISEAAMFFSFNAKWNEISKTRAFLLHTK